MGNGDTGSSRLLHSQWFSGRKGMVLRVLIIVVIFSIGLIIGYVLRRSVHEMAASPDVCTPDGALEVRQQHAT